MTSKKKTGAAVPRHELFAFLDSNPSVTDAHGAWLAAGGDKLLDLAVNAIRGEMFPYDQPQHVQASFGAFVGGATWMAKLLRNLIAVSNNRAETARVLSQADPSISPEERALLRRLYGLSDEEIAGNFGKQPGQPG